MDLKDLKTKNVSELQSILSDWRDKWRELRFKNSNHQLKEIRQIRQIRKNIARVLTLINQNQKNKK